MAYKSNNIVVIDDSRAGFISNITIQNNGFLEVNSSDGFQGTVAGYLNNTDSGVLTFSIVKFPFAVDTNSTDVGDLPLQMFRTTGQSSTTHGYTTSGRQVPIGVAASNAIQKYPFAVDTNGTIVGNLTFGGYSGGGQSSSTHGYHSGGYSPGVFFNTIDKFPFAIDSNSTNIGDFSEARRTIAGQSSTTHGYISGGAIPPPFTPVNTIDKFPFATDTNSTDIGDLSQTRGLAAGQSSVTHGYTSGGLVPGQIVSNTIDKFPFATDTNATDIGDLSESRSDLTGQSSTTHGYSSGGVTPSSSNVIDKFPFASDANATDVGDVNHAGRCSGGAQD